MTDCPQRGAESFEAHQHEVALWMGYPNADALNAHHDALHFALCDWLGIESMAMRDAAGETLGEAEATLAALEEDAVLRVQRLMAHAGIGVPQ